MKAPEIDIQTYEDPAAVPKWCEKYIGIPETEGGRSFEGVDCWGVPVLVYKEELGIDLPFYGAEVDPAEQRENLIGVGEETWEKVSSVEDAKPFDLLEIVVHGKPHVGVVVSSTMMLHVRAGVGVLVERYKGGLWARTTRGIFRRP